MSELEEKLRELGYIRYGLYNKYINESEKNIILWYQKLVNTKIIKIEINEEYNQIENCCIDLGWGTIIKNFEQVNEIIEAFNVMQMDLEVLKQCQN